MSDLDRSNLEHRSPSIWPTALKFALIILAFKLIYGFASRAWLAGIPGLGLIGFVITVVILVMALRAYRRVNGGFMTFGQAFGVAFIASVVPAIVNAAVAAVYIATLGREELIAQRDTMLNELSASPGMDAQAMDMVTSIFDAVFTPGGIFLAGSIGGAIGWTLASLILAAVMKKSPPLA